MSFTIVKTERYSILVHISSKNANATRKKIGIAKNTTASQKTNNTINETDTNLPSNFVKTKRYSVLVYTSSNDENASKKRKSIAKTTNNKKKKTTVIQKTNNIMNETDKDLPSISEKGGSVPSQELAEKAVVASTNEDEIKTEQNQTDTVVLDDGVQLEQNQPTTVPLQDDAKPEQKQPDTVPLQDDAQPEQKQLDTNPLQDAVEPKRYRSNTRALKGGAKKSKAKKSSLGSLFCCRIVDVVDGATVDETI